ncbi:Beta-galactosidase [Jatrophihabitans endophyticus]|uniref:Beta-galactosidase n=1 Tax=Jatrophihabitans endophyticus TaxID=1206085 RepID=A0A1M5ILZ9_9ACTN|nr:Beta-galactosidase [Jatrophihabitans endophyticus]
MLLGLLAAVAVAVALVVVLVTRDGGSDACADLPAGQGISRVGTPSAAPFVGTLGTHPETADDESRAGIKVAMVELAWRDFEPAKGRFDAAYADRVCARIRTYEQAGMQVTLGLGLHYAPAWLLAIPGSRFVDQDGHRSDEPDLVFNRDLRRLADRYLAKIDELIGLQHFWAVRVTAGGNAELLYPRGNRYWAFSDGAQGGPQRPASMAPNPLPGWRPGTGDTSPALAQREAWARWYVAGLTDVANWQLGELRRLGFTGYLQLLTPGQGIRPAQVAPRVAAGLPNGLFGRGAVWSWVYAGLTVRDGVTAYVSSVADGSGDDDACGPDDEAVRLESRTVLDWSAARWISRLARHNGFSVAGEVPSLRDSAKRRAYYRDPSDDGLAARAYAQAKGCGFLGLYWAHDDQVRDGTVSVDVLGRLAGPDALPPAPAGG